MYLYGIIGHPLGHSLSPVLHNWMLARAGHPGIFEAWPTPPEDLAKFVKRVRSLPIHGLAVTIPHKTAVLPLLDGLTAEARAVGAVNTLFWREEALWGHNTDVTGFLAPLRTFCAKNGTPRSALVLGAGGAANAVLYGLQSLGIKDMRLAARNERSGEGLAARFGVSFTPWEKRAAAPAQLVVNATPLGMAGSAGAGESPLSDAEFSALNEGFAPGGCLAYDLVYNPLQTPFLRVAETSGRTVQEGLTMLAAQGLAQFELWTGLDAPPLSDAVGKLKAALKI